MCVSLIGNARATRWKGRKWWHWANGKSHSFPLWLHLWPWAWFYYQDHLWIIPFLFSLGPTWSSRGPRPTRSQWWRCEQHFFSSCKAKGEKSDFRHLSILDNSKLYSHFPPGEDGDINLYRNIRLIDLGNPWRWVAWNCNRLYEWVVQV